MRSILYTLLLFLFFVSACSRLPPKKEEPLFGETFAKKKKSDPELLPYYNLELGHPIHHFDLSLKNQPRRIWRLWVRWLPDPADTHRAYLNKVFMYVVHEPSDRKSLEDEIKSRGGEANYLQWFSSQVFPVSALERKTRGDIVRLTDATVALIAFEATESILREDIKDSQLHVLPVEFPEPVLNSLREGCGPEKWEYVAKDESFGFEVLLQSRAQDPKAYRWKPISEKHEQLEWQAWSTGSEHQITYKTVLFTKENFSRCPPPSEMRESLSKLLSLYSTGQATGLRTGVDW